MPLDNLTQLASEALLLILQLSAPLVGVAALIGLLLGFLQAVTQLQDQTTTFAIKLLAVMALLVVLMPWLGTQMSHYSERLFDLVVKVKV
jgi:type III secretion protein S